MRAFSSVGKSSRLITGRSRVRIPEGPPGRNARVIFFFLFYVVGKWERQGPPNCCLSHPTKLLQPIILGCSQVVRQGTLTPSSAGSSPAIPATFRGKVHISLSCLPDMVGLLPHLSDHIGETPLNLVKKVNRKEVCDYASGFGRFDFCRLRAHPE